jgi:hypothetical protein
MIILFYMISKQKNTTKKLNYKLTKMILIFLILRNVDTL